jgi:DNA-binding NtrC family response regulator
VSLKVLVVEGDRDLIHTFKQLLDHDGHVVFTARRAGELAAAVSPEVPDVVFLDLDMVDITASDFTAAITPAGTEPPPVILVGSGIARPDGALMHKFGAVEFLATPFGAIQLRTAVARAYGPRFLQRTAAGA